MVHIEILWRPKLTHVMICCEYPRHSTGNVTVLIPSSNVSRVGNVGPSFRVVDVNVAEGAFINQ